MARSALVRACRGPLDCRAAAAWAPQCGPGALSEAPPRESAGFGRVWPSRLALKYKGEVDCYEVEQGASLPLLQRLEVTRCTYTPAHTLASPSKVTRARPPTHPYTPLQVKRVPWLQVFDSDHATRLASQPAGVSDAAGSKCSRTQQAMQPRPALQKPTHLLRAALCPLGS
jgi:hypothetical protein